MTKTLHATYDGEVLRPDEALPLEPNTRVRITIDSIDDSSDAPQSFLDTALSLKLEGPPDWSERLDDYLHGDRVIPDA